MELGYRKFQDNGNNTVVNSYREKIYWENAPYSSGHKMLMIGAEVAVLLHGKHIFYLADYWPNDVMIIDFENMEVSIPESFGHTWKTQNFKRQRFQVAQFGNSFILYGGSLEGNWPDPFWPFSDASPNPYYVVGLSLSSKKIRNPQSATLDSKNIAQNMDNSNILTIELSIIFLVIFSTFCIYVISNNIKYTRIVEHMYQRKKNIVDIDEKYKPVLTKKDKKMVDHSQLQDRAPPPPTKKEKKKKTDKNEEKEEKGEEKNNNVIEKVERSVESIEDEKKSKDVPNKVINEMTDSSKELSGRHVDYVKKKEEIEPSRNKGKEPVRQEPKRQEPVQQIRKPVPVYIPYYGNDDSDSEDEGTRQDI